MQDFDIKLAHVHANNFSPIRSNDELPLVLELTFSRHAERGETMNLPHPLDMPNDGLTNEITLNVRTA